MDRSHDGGAAETDSLGRVKVLMTRSGAGSSALPADSPPGEHRGGQGATIKHDSVAVLTDLDLCSGAGS